MKKNILIAVLALVVVAVLLGCLVYKDKHSRLDSAKNNDWIKYYATDVLPFSIIYPKEFELVDDRVVLAPNYEEYVPAKSLVRKINKEHCDLSGLPEHCRPYTENPKITFALVYVGNENSLKKEWTELFGESQLVEIGGTEFDHWTMGVEGEGVNYFFTRMSPEYLLMFSYTYLDGNILSDYPKAFGFLDIGEQEMIFKSIVSSLRQDQF